GRPMLRVLNKVDRLTQEQRESLSKSCQRNGDAPPVLVSALEGIGLEELLRRIDAAIPVDPMISVSLRVPLTEGRTLALLHALGRVRKSRVQDSHMLLDADVPESIVRRLDLDGRRADGTSAISPA